MSFYRSIHVGEDNDVCEYHIGQTGVKFKLYNGATPFVTFAEMISAGTDIELDDHGQLCSDITPSMIKEYVITNILDI